MPRTIQQFLSAKKRGEVGIDPVPPTKVAKLRRVAVRFDPVRRPEKHHQGSGS